MPTRRSGSQRRQRAPQPARCSSRTRRNAPTCLGSIGRPQAPLESRQLIDLIGLRLTRGTITRSCRHSSRKVMRGVRLAPNTKTDHSWWNEHCSSKRNRKQGKRLGTKPRTVQTGGVYRCRSWKLRSGSGLIFEADSDGTFSRLRRLA